MSELEKTLLTLICDQSLYGTQFVDAIRLSSEGNREIGVGSLYPTLGRMEKKGFVTWHWGDEETGPRRKYYDITPYGKTLLEKDWRFQKKIKQYRVESIESKPTGTVEAKALTTAEKPT